MVHYAMKYHFCVALAYLLLSVINSEKICLTVLLNSVNSVVPSQEFPLKGILSTTWVSGSLFAFHLTDFKNAFYIFREKRLAKLCDVFRATLVVSRE